MNAYERAVAIWRTHHPDLPGFDASRAMALDAFRILFAYNSCKIENDNVTHRCTREIFKYNTVTNYTGDLRTLYEIHNAKKADDFLRSAFQDQRPLDEALVLELHQILTQNTYDARHLTQGERPGEYRHQDYAAGFAAFGAAPEDVQKEMAELLAMLAYTPEGKDLIVAAYFHAKFEEIRPFAEGNGPVGRLLLNYFLVLHDYPPLIVHEEDRTVYCSALEAWNQWENLVPLVSFLRATTVKSWGIRE